jgi:hypothetical protein
MLGFGRFVHQPSVSYCALALVGLLVLWYAVSDYCKAYCKARPDTPRARRTARRWNSRPKGAQAKIERGPYLEGTGRVACAAERVADRNETPPGAEARVPAGLPKATVAES